MPDTMFDLTGKTALITGSSRGIGLSLAKGLGGAGASLILNGINEERLQKTAAEMAIEGFDVSAYAFDITDKKQVQENILLIEKQKGPIDILVNNAGVQSRGTLEDFEVSEWERVINTNLTGVFLVTQSVIKDMIRRKSGKIINVCSLQSELGRPTIAPYTAAKGGVKMLTKAMTAEWAKHNIQINGIGPGYFITDMTRSLVEDEKFDKWIRARTPAGRWGNQDELVGTVIFLASKASDFINGQIIYIDGGLMSVI